MYDKIILKHIDSINEIPTMFKIALELERLLRDSKTSAHKISEIIRVDPALTGKVLKIANSVVYASSKRIISLKQAIARLGFTEIRRLTMSIAVINSFKNYFVDYEKFWIHSISVAFMTVELAKKSKLKFDEGEVYVCGMLHDIGVIIFDQFFTNLYKKVFDIASKKRFDLELVEKKLLGISHSEVGATLLGKWKLPQQITNVIRYHHSPQNLTDESGVCKLVYLANFICNNQGIDNGTEYFPEGFYDDIWDDLGLSVDDIPAILESMNTHTEKAVEILRLGGK